MVWNSFDPILLRNLHGTASSYERRNLWNPQIWLKTNVASYERSIGTILSDWPIPIPAFGELVLLSWTLTVTDSDFV
jgi:hypothetical protein